MAIDPHPVVAPGPVTAGTVADGSIDPADGGLNVHVAGGSTTAAPQADTSTATHVASVTLPAAGADLTYNGTNYPNGRITTNGAPRVTFKWTYASGGTGGCPGHHAEFSDGTSTWRQEITDANLTPTGSEAARQRYQVEDIESTGVTAGDYSVDIPRGVTTVRLVPREVGNTGSPGTYAATFALGWAGAS